MSDNWLQWLIRVGQWTYWKWQWQSFEFWQFCDWIILKWLIKLICRFYLISELKFQQELSYRKQIVRQLCTQFLEGISVTVKSTLRVTQCHWKRNHWTDHTRLTIRRVIGCWVLSWPWNVGQKSLKIIEISAIWKLGWLGYCMVKKLWQYVKPFTSDTGTSRTDGRTDLLYQELIVVEEINAVKNFNENTTERQKWFPFL